MSRFDHLDTGTPESAWHLDGLPHLALPVLGDRVVVLAAHPDDETLGAGGVLAACARRGIEIVVIVACDGEASHPRSPTMRPDDLAHLRRHEVQAALDVLAPGAKLHFLGLPDGVLTENRAALTAQVRHLAQRATHLLSPWDGDRHPDHTACALAAADAAGPIGAAHWQYPIWAWHWAEPDSADLPTTLLNRVELSAAEVAAKQRALACHRSQHAALSDAAGDEPILSPAMLAHFERPFECFVSRKGAAELVRTAARPALAAQAEYFDELYGRADDPWGLAERFYEQRKRALQLAALPRPRFRRAFEPGCATGLLTEQLARRCDAVLAWDLSDRALEQTRARVGATPGVVVEAGQIPGDWPDGRFDLIVISEVGYYCLDLDQLVDRVLAGLADDGVVLACHWRHPAPDHPHSADAVHRALGSHLPVIASHVEEDFLLDVWSVRGRSVAVLDGIVDDVGS